MIKVAYGKHFESGHAVQQCIAALDGTAPRMLLMFCGGKHLAGAVLPLLRDAFGAIPIVGGSAAGAIWNEGSGYSGLEIGLVAFLDDAVVPDLLVTHDLLNGEYEAGYDLGRRVAAHAADDAVVMLFFDSVAKSSPLRLHPASTIVGGFSEGLGGKPIKLLGGGMLTDMNMSDGWVFDGQGAHKHTAVALIFPPGITAEASILHGCRPVSTFMEITRIDGADVLELDGQPALQVIERMLGLPVGSSQGQDLSLIATLGEKQGDPFAPYDENAYVNRLILRCNPDAGSITLFEPDFARGTHVQIMSRDNALMLDSVKTGIAAISDASTHAEAFLALYIDCAGRASARSGAQVEEADLVRQSLPPKLPLLGFYSGVEVAPFEGYSRPLDWTGVIVILRNTATR